MKLSIPEQMDLKKYQGESRQGIQGRRQLPLELFTIIQEEEITLRLSTK